MKHLSVILLCLFSLHINAQAIDKTQIENTIDTIFKPFNNSNSPGVAVSVIQNGKIVTRKNYGMANLEHNIAFTHQSPVRLIYSMGREFMLPGLALMEAQGLLSFDDKVRDYLPKLPEWSKDVTLQNLLDHKSGFDDEWSLLLIMTEDMRSQVKDEQVLRLLYDQPKPQIEPGKGYMYNNTDMALLRMVMEMASKQSLPDYLKKNLYDPLGMSSTFMNDNIEVLIPGFADSYYGFNPVKKARFYKFSPGGNYRIVTTASDLEKWLIAIDDETSFLAKAFERLYRDSQPIPVMSPDRHYTFGHEWQKSDTLEYVYHGGVGDSFYMFRIPSKKVSVIGFGNSGASIGATMQLAESMLPPKVDSEINVPTFPENKVTLANNQLEKYAGRYVEQNAKQYNSHINSISFYDIKQEGDSLNFYYETNASFPMIAFGNGFFKDLEMSTLFRFTQSHSDSSMNLLAWQIEGGKPILLKRDNAKGNVTKEYLDQFTGQFYSPHLDYYLRIVLEDDKLIIKRPTTTDKIMEPYGENRFMFAVENGAYTSYTTATFTKNKAGRVDGFTLQDSRTMHHRFDKVK